MKTIRISQVDALFANGRYSIEFLFYYRNGVPTAPLKKALRALAPTFWPLFGEYKDGVISFDGYREENAFDEGAVDSELDVTAIQDGGPEVISRFGQSGRSGLFFLKAIRFRNGTALVPMLKHVAGDGYSYFTFLSVLAAFARPSSLPFKSSIVKSLFRPHHRRTVMREFSFQGNAPEPDSRNERLTTRSEEIPRKEVRAQIEDAASSLGLRLSSNDVLSALFLKKLVGITRESWPGRVSLTIPIDVRGRIKEYGRRYIGNGLMFHNVDFEKDRLEDSPPLEISAQIRRSMPTVTMEGYVRYLEGLEKIIAERDWDRFRPFDPKCGCLVTNLSRLPAERLDFGTGVPDAIIPLTIEGNSAGILSRGDNYVLRYAF